MKIESGLDGRRPRVEMVPLLDVLLIVLIFFLYLSLTFTSRRAVDVNLPSARGAPAAPAATVVVTKEGHVMVDGKSVTPSAAVELVLRDTRGDEHPHILLRSDRSSQLGVTIDLMSRLHRAGIEEVSIEVDGS